MNKIKKEMKDKFKKWSFRDWFSFIIVIFALGFMIYRNVVFKRGALVYIILTSAFLLWGLLPRFKKSLLKETSIIFTLCAIILFIFHYDYFGNIILPFAALLWAFGSNE